MEDARGGSQARRLRAVGDGPVSDPAVLEAAISVCVAVTPVSSSCTRMFHAPRGPRAGTAKSNASPAARYTTS